MAKLIKSIYDWVALATDKGLTSYWPDDQIMNVIDSVQMALYRPLIEQFAKTKQIRNELLPFQKRTTIVIASKVGSMPADFEHEIDLWSTVNSVDYKIRIFESGTFRNRLTDPVDVPSTTNLIANIYNDGSGKKIEISNQITPITINYFKRPTKPVYATTIVTGTQVYDDAGSTDVDWSPLVWDIISERSLAALGLGIRDQQVQRIGQAPQPKEASIAS